MLRKSIAIFMALALFWTAASYDAIASISPAWGNGSPLIALTSDRLSNGQYPVQQATYNDVDGEYSLMLLGTPVGSSPVLTTDKLQMARLSDEEIANGKKTYIEVDGDRAIMYLTEDFKIEYVHNVTETQPDPQTGQPQTVVVRRESSFWTPFAGALAGQALGSLLFTPQYYFPPVYHPGGVLTGYGGYGNTYGQAVERYQSRYNTAPPAVKNRQTLRTTGNLRKSTSKSPTRGKFFRGSPSKATKSSGSGYGASKLRSSGKSGFTGSKRRSSFGSSSGMRTKSFGSMRRRR